SEEALEIAKKNISGLIKGQAFSKRPGLLWLKSDLLTGYPKKSKFDLIVANLPYIPSARIPKLPESVKGFEPHLALDGGSDGLKLINKLIAQSKTRLKPNGALLLEVDETHALSDFKIPQCFRAEILKDQFGKRRFVKMGKKR
ncbi:MAG: peptide chain release factor N(5)-glutamine methyltransferase, partial [Patescibacteria group bacterium]